MGAKTWILAYQETDSAGDVLKNKPKTNQIDALNLAKKLFPKEKLESIHSVSLLETSPPDNEIYIGCFPGLKIIIASDFAIDNPSKLPNRFIKEAQGQTTYLHAMHSSVDWFAYAIWRDGELKRSLSLSPDNGIIENIGIKSSFEEPYWEGRFPAIDPKEEDADEYPFPFHPLELGEATLRALFNFQLEGEIDSTLVNPEDISLIAFKRSKPWWKIF